MIRIFSAFALTLLLLTAVAAARAAEPDRQGGAGAIPYREEKPVQENTSRALVSSLVLLGVAGVVLFMVKRRLPGGRISKAVKTSLSVIDSARLGTSARLWVVEFEGERLLVAENSSQITLLARRDAMAAPPAGTAENP